MHPRAKHRAAFLFRANTLCTHGTVHPLSNERPANSMNRSFTLWKSVVSGIEIAVNVRKARTSALRRHNMTSVCSQSIAHAVKLFREPPVVCIEQGHPTSHHCQTTVAASHFLFFEMESVREVDLRGLGSHDLITAAASDQSRCGTALTA